MNSVKVQMHLEKNSNRYVTELLLSMLRPGISWAPSFANTLTKDSHLSKPYIPEKCLKFICLFPRNRTT